MSKDSLIPPEIMALVGRERVFSCSQELGKAAIRRFAAAIGDRNHLYWDEEFARNSRYGGVIAPPTFIFELNHNIGAELAQDGLGVEEIEARFPLGTLFRGGNEYEIFQPARPDDVITIRRKVADIYQKPGRRGTLVFVISEISYVNQRGELLGVNRESFIFRRESEEK